MFKQVVFLCVIVGAFGLPQFRQGRTDESTAQILKSSNNNEGTGEFIWNFETENQLRANAEGRLKQLFPDQPKTLAVSGSWSYVNPDGKTVNVQYTADENGYRESRTIQ